MRERGAACVDSSTASGERKTWRGEAGLEGESPVEISINTPVYQGGGLGQGTAPAAGPALYSISSVLA